MAKDHYETLGVSKNATKEELSEIVGNKLAELIKKKISIKL